LLFFFVCVCGIDDGIVTGKEPRTAWTFYSMASATSRGCSSSLTRFCSSSAHCCYRFRCAFKGFHKRSNFIFFSPKEREVGNSSKKIGWGEKTLGFLVGSRVHATNCVTARAAYSPHDAAKGPSFCVYVAELWCCDACTAPCAGKGISSLKNTCCYDSMKARVPLPSQGAPSPPKPSGPPCTPLPCGPA
jgi:hypothetical protein